MSDGTFSSQGSAVDVTSWRRHRGFAGAVYSTVGLGLPHPLGP